MRNKTILLAIAGTALAIAAPGASAQTKKAPAKPAPAAEAPAPSSAGIGEGDTELNFFGSLSDHESLGTSITFGVALGKYVSDDLQLKLTQSMTILDSDAFSLFSYIPYGSVEYQIRPAAGSPFVFYVGGGGGLNLTTIDAGGFDFFTYSLFLTPTAGAKYFIAENMSLTYSLSYQFPLLEESCDATTCTDSETTTLQNFLGFSVYY
jgi:hypothetical protein